MDNEAASKEVTNMPPTECAPNEPSLAASPSSVGAGWKKIKKMQPVLNLKKKNEMPKGKDGKPLMEPFEISMHAPRTTR